MSDMDVLRKRMDAELKRAVVPLLREMGFKGSFPHFRRMAETHIDLVTFQFDRHGGGFVIEIARCPPKGIVTYWGKHIPSEKVSAWDVHPDRRKRLKPRDGAGTDSWFRFDKQPIETIPARVAELLRRSEIWDDVQIAC